MLTNEQESDLRTAFEGALKILLQENKDIARVETSYAGHVLSAVTIVVGGESTRQVIKVTDRLMGRWDQVDGAIR